MLHETSHWEFDTVKTIIFNVIGQQIVKCFQGAISKMFLKVVQDKNSSE